MYLAARGLELQGTSLAVTDGHFESEFPLPNSSLTQGHHSVPALSTLSHALKPDWRSEGNQFLNISGTIIALPLDIRMNTDFNMLGSQGKN